MKATAGRPQSVGRGATAGRTQPVEHGRVSLTSSLVWSLVLHGALVLWLLGSAWLLGRAQPYRLAPQTVFLVGDSPVAIDQVLGEGGGVPAAKPDNKEPGGEKSTQVETNAAPVVEKFAPPVEKPVPPPPQPVVEKAVTAPPPKPVVEKVAPPPPKPVVEKVAPPPPKPVVEKVVPAPLKPPPEAMPLVQKETKPTPPPAPPTSTSSEAQQKLAKLRERQIEQERAETKTATAVQQKMAQLREQQAQQEAAEQRIAALRARVGGGGSGEGSGASGSGTAGTGSGSGAPGGGRGTGTAGAGSTGTGGLSGIRMRAYREELRDKIENAWNIPAQSKGLKAVFFLSINRAGQVEQARLVQGSGNALFDESLQRAIQRAQPFPALPEDFPARTFDVPLNFQDLR